MIPPLVEAIDYSKITEAGAVGLCTLALITLGLFGRSVLRMLEKHINRLNGSIELHTSLLQTLVNCADRQEKVADQEVNLLHQIASSQTSALAVAQAAASAAAAAAAASAIAARSVAAESVEAKGERP